MLISLLKEFWVRFPVALLGVRIVVMLVAFSAHELGHALAATALGDPTPRQQGRLTLNPLRHVEHIGALTGVLMGIGWSRRTIILPHRMRVPAWLGGPLAVIAGPLANVGLVIGGLALMQGSGLAPQSPWHAWPTLAEVLTVVVRFNLMMALLNLLPLFPLDAFQAIHFVLPSAAMSWWQRASGWTTAALGVGIAGLLVLPTPLIAPIIGPMVRWANTTLLGW